MSEPYNPAMIAKALKSLSTEYLGKMSPLVFQTWPVAKIVPLTVIKDLISQEIAGRGQG